MNRPLPPEAGNSRAVVVGTWKYEDPDLGPDLPAVKNSFNRFIELLTSPLCGWPTANVISVTNESHPGLVPDLLMTQFAAATDVALFYYVGHGLLSDDEEVQLCLALSGTVKGPYRAVPTSLLYPAVRRALLRSPARTKIVILDCCNSSIALPPRLGQTDAAAAEAVPEELLEETGVERTSVWVAAARKYAYYEADPAIELPQTYFTKHLADLIERGIDDGPPELTMKTLFRRLEVSLREGGHSRPGARGDSDGDHPFCRNAVLMPKPWRVLRMLGDQSAAVQQTLRGLSPADQHELIKVLLTIPEGGEILASNLPVIGAAATEFAGHRLDDGETATAERLLALIEAARQLDDTQIAGNAPTADSQDSHLLRAPTPPVPAPPTTVPAPVSPPHAPPAQPPVPVAAVAHTQLDLPRHPSNSVFPAFTTRSGLAAPREGGGYASTIADGDDSAGSPQSPLTSGRETQPKRLNRRTALIGGTVAAILTAAVLIYAERPTGSSHDAPTSPSHGTSAASVMPAVSASGSSGRASHPSSPSPLRTSPSPTTMGTRNTGQIPGRVTGVTVTAGDGRVVLDWQAAPGKPTGYQVEVSPAPTGGSGLQRLGTATSDTVTGLTNGTTYTFTVAATSTAGNGPQSLAVTAVPTGKPVATAAPLVTNTGSNGTSSIIEVSAETSYNTNGLPPQYFTVYEYKASSSSGPFGGNPVTSERQSPNGGNISVPRFTVSNNGSWYEYAYTVTTAAGTSALSPLSSPAIQVPVASTTSSPTAAG